LRRRRSAKIVATVGPASAGLERIRALFEAGVDVFRIFDSLNNTSGMRVAIEAVREDTNAICEAAICRRPKALRP